VVRTLAKRLTDGERIGDLRATVHRLPQDVAELFESIRRQIDPRHVKQSSQYFLLLLEAQRETYTIPPSAVTFFLAEEDEASLIHRDFLRTSESKQSWMVSTMRRRLHSRTMGLVETLDSGSVTFLHRTVLEWFTRPENLTAIKRDASTGFNPNLELFKARTTEISAVARPPSNSGRRELGTLWLLFEICLTHAALASYRPEDKQRLVRTFDRLEGYTHHILDVEQLHMYHNRRTFDVVFGRKRMGSHTHINFIHMAARFAIAPLLMAKVDKAALRSRMFPLSYQDLLGDAVFGRLTIESPDRMPAFDPDMNPGLEWPMLRLFEARLEILKHLFHIAPQSWAKRRALETIIAEIRKSLRFSDSNSSEKEYLVDVEALFQRELSLRVWISRYIVKKREAGLVSGTEGESVNVK
jgi:hypothetical protein